MPTRSLALHVRLAVESEAAVRPSFVAILRNPIAALGVALTTAAGLLFVFLVIVQAVGLLPSPYVGLVVYVMAPGIFTIGLVLIPVGLWIERRRVRRGRPVPTWPRFDLNDPAMRRTLIWIIAATAANLIIISTASYGAVHYTESTAFCGQVCHSVMQPEYEAHDVGPHAKVRCVECHVGEGAQGFVDAKLSGTRQLALMLSGSHAAPIPTPVRNLPGVQGTCETCHRENRFVGNVVRTIYEHGNDEQNTESKTVVTLKVGGHLRGAASHVGIHWHADRGNTVEYLARDAKREQIPYVKVTTPDGQVREYFGEGVTRADVAGQPTRRMDCLDCHSRPAHSFATSAEQEVDDAIGTGEMSAKVPFVRREAVKALKVEYPNRDVALTEIEKAMRAALTPTTPPESTAALAQAVAVTKAIYQANVFPSMKVTWGTYQTQLGHATSPGCFRCHDDSHKTAEGKAISQDCELCHTIE